MCYNSLVNNKDKGKDNTYVKVLQDDGSTKHNAVHYVAAVPDIRDKCHRHGGIRTQLVHIYIGYDSDMPGLHDSNVGL